MLSNILTIIVAICSVIPAIVSAVQNGHIKEGAYDEVIDALSKQFQARVDAANAAAKETVNENIDPYNRTR